MGAGEEDPRRIPLACEQRRRWGANGEAGGQREGQLEVQGRDFGLGDKPQGV